MHEREHKFTDSELELIARATRDQVRKDGKLDYNLLRKRLGLRLDIETAAIDIFTIIAD